MKTLMFRIAFLTLFCVSNFVVAQGLPTASPSCVGLNANKLEAITDEIQRLVDNKEMAGGVVLVAKDGKTVFKQAVGFSSIETQSPMQTDQIFRIASNSKIMVSLALYLLWEDRLVGLDDPIAWYLPEFNAPEVIVIEEGTTPENFETVAAANEITVRHLLNHTSGLEYRSNNSVVSDLYARAGITDGFAPVEGTIGDMVRNIAMQPLRYQPGDRWNYSLSHDVLGHLIEVVSGQNLADFMHERIFAPLEMNDTSFFVPREKEDRLAETYIYDFNTLTISPFPSEGVELFPNLIIGGGAATTTGATYFSGGSGLVSTVDDMARFFQMLLEKGKLKGSCGEGKTKIAKTKTIKEMLTHSERTSVAVDEGTEAFFQLSGHKFANGFWIKTDNSESNRPTPEGAFGWAGLFNTHYFVDPEHDIVAIVATQVFPYGQFGLQLKLEDAVYSALED